MDNDLKAAALEIFKKSSLGDSEDEVSEDSAAAPPAETEAPAAAPAAKTATGGDPAATGMARQATAGMTARRKSAMTTQRRLEPHAATPSAVGAGTRAAGRGGGGGAMLVLMILNVLTLVFVIVLAMQVANLQRTVDLQAGRLADMSEKVTVASKFSRQKFGVYEDPNKGPQGVILTYDVNGNIEGRRIVPITLP